MKQDCQIELWSRTVKQHCQAELSRRTVKQDFNGGCQEGISSKTFTLGCQAGLSNRAWRQDCQGELWGRTVKQDCKGDLWSTTETEKQYCQTRHWSRAIGQGCQEELWGNFQNWSFELKASLNYYKLKLLYKVMIRFEKNNFWFPLRVLTGAFDKVVKVWSQDGQVMHKFDGFRYIAYLYTSIFFSLGVMSIKFVSNSVNRTHVLRHCMFHRQSF